ncbi:MAG: YceI family protein [Ferruginibacter sp.]
MKKILFAVIFTASTLASSAQLVATKTGKISFSSRSKIENIDAVNNEVNSIINTQTGDIVFTLLMKSFHFERALMEEHFNENYVESSKYPKASFKGKITNLSEINFTTDGKYKAKVEGDLTIHGVTQKIKADGFITVAGGKVSASSQKFEIKLKDYNISIPSLVKDKISEDIDIVVDCRYEAKK